MVSEARLWRYWKKCIVQARIDREHMGEECETIIHGSRGAETGRPAGAPKVLNLGIRHVTREAHQRILLY